MDLLLPADLQDSPDEIPELYRMIMRDGYDLVSGWKRKRYDPLSKTIPTKLFNATARKVSGIKNLHDFNCGLKAYRLEVVKHIEVYGDMHRYIPYLAKNAGFNRIGEKEVHHQARKYGTTKFGLDRFVNGNHPVKLGDFVGRILKVGVHRDYYVAFRSLETGVESRRLAIVASERNPVHSRILGAKLLYHLPRVVGASVVDKNHFVCEVVVSHDTFNPCRKLRKRLGFIVKGYDH